LTETVGAIAKVERHDGGPPCGGPFYAAGESRGELFQSQHALSNLVQDPHLNH